MKIYRFMKFNILRNTHVVNREIFKVFLIAINNNINLYQ